MSLNVTNITNANVESLTGLFGLANDLSYGVFGTVVFFVLFGLVFTTLWSRSNRLKETLIGAGLTTFFMGLLLSAIGILDSYWLVVSLLVFASGLFIE